ncbi:hypothetical protein D3C73_1262860 [compost metagenome]
MNLQDGVKSIFSGDHPTERQDSHGVQMIDQGFVAAQAFGKAILLLDRYFLSIPALRGGCFPERSLHNIYMITYRQIL